MDDIFHSPSKTIELPKKEEGPIITLVEIQPKDLDCIKQ